MANRVEIIDKSHGVEELAEAGGNYSMGTNKITSLADGVDSGDAVNKGQLDDKQDIPGSSTTTSTATLTPALATANVWQLTAQEEELTIAEPTGTPVLGETIHIMIKDDGTARAINWNSAYKAVGEALLETTTAGKWIKAIATYNGTDWLTSSVNEV